MNFTVCKVLLHIFEVRASVFILTLQRRKLRKLLHVKARQLQHWYPNSSHFQLPFQCSQWELGGRGDLEGDMFEPSFEGNHVFECRGCLLQLPQQAVRRRSLVRGPDCCQGSPCYSWYPWGLALRPAWGNRDRSLLHIMFGVKQALGFVFLRPNRKATSK